MGDYTCITGGVHIGQSCYLGSNCTIVNEMEIADYGLVGMGSVVVGNPARFLRETSPDL